LTFQYISPLPKVGKEMTTISSYITIFFVPWLFDPLFIRWSGGDSAQTYGSIDAELTEAGIVAISYSSKGIADLVSFIQNQGLAPISTIAKLATPFIKVKWK